MLEFFKQIGGEVLRGIRKKKDNQKHKTLRQSLVEVKKPPFLKSCNRPNFFFQCPPAKLVQAALPLRKQIFKRRVVSTPIYDRSGFASFNATKNLAGAWHTDLNIVGSV